MKLTVQGKGPVTLTDRDFNAEGGEGKIYVKGGVVYKVGHDYKDMPPEAKIRELQMLDHPDIIRPIDILLDDKNKPIGFTMPLAPNSTHMSRMFTTDFRNENGITPDIVLRLIERMRNAFSFVHSKGCLIVDANENNFLINEVGFDQAFFIDICSYQTPSFPATAIMANVEDYHANRRWSTNTDWYSFGVLACQLILGIHPFKGNHPKFKRNDFIARMKANVSIFNAEVTMPAVVRDMSLIPVHYKDWMIQVFEKGARIPFPDKAGKVGVVLIAVSVPIETGNFKIVVLESFPREVAQHIDYLGQIVTIFNDRSLVYNRITYPANKPYDGAVFTERMLRPYKVVHTPDTVSIEALDGAARLSTIAIAANAVTVIDNRIYAISDQALIELRVIEAQNDILAVSKQWPLLPGHTETYNGILAVNALGTPYLIIPSATGMCHFVKFPELAGYRLIAAKHENRVAVLVGQKGAQLDRFVVRFDKNYSTHVVQKEEDVATADINFAVLPNGICVHIPEDGRVEVFSNDPASTKARNIHDPKVTSKMRLGVSGTKIVFRSGSDLCSLTMR